MNIKLKRIYDQPDAKDGVRILVDRLWPRGVAKEAAKIDDWVKDIAPSAELRKWFNHDPGKWEEFQKRYIQELSQDTKAVAHVLMLARKYSLTLVYASKSTHNQAVVLKAYLERKLGRSSR